MNKYRVKLLTYRDQTFNSFVYKRGDIFETCNLDEAEKERDKWSSRNPDGVYVVFEVQDEGTLPDV